MGIMAKSSTYKKWLRQEKHASEDHHSKQKGRIHVFQQHRIICKYFHQTLVVYGFGFGSFLFNSMRENIPHLIKSKTKHNKTKRQQIRSSKQNSSFAISMTLRKLNQHQIDKEVN